MQPSVSISVALMAQMDGHVERIISFDIQIILGGLPFNGG